METTVERAVCSWCAGCVRLADGCVSHPVLGWVPTCATCADRLSLDLVRGEVTVTR